MKYYKGDIIEVLSWINTSSPVGTRHHVIEQRGDIVCFWREDYRTGLHKNMVTLYKGTFFNTIRRLI